MMTRFWWLGPFGLVLLLLSTSVHGQSSLEMLQHDLDQLDKEHQEASTKNLDSILSTLDSASASPDAAVQLYMQSGGVMPEAAKIRTTYEHETPTEKEERASVDQAMLAEFGGMVQLHVGLLHLAVMYVSRPDSNPPEKELVDWLKSSAPNYPQVNVPIIDPRVPPEVPDTSVASQVGRLDGPDPAPSSGDSEGGRRRRRSSSPAPEADKGKIIVGASLKSMSMEDSVIANALGFHGWGDKDQGKWKVADMPALYKQHVLDPLRKNPSPETLAAWDTYIAMMNADETDQEKWNQMDLPPLQFEKDCDDFAIKPGTEKIETLLSLIKTNQDHPDSDKWLERVHKMLKDYQAQQSGTAAAN